LSQAIQKLHNLLIRVAIYARLSDEDKNKTSYSEKSESIKNQITLATKFAQENGWKIVEVYSDDDWSGLDRDRPEFNRLLEDCEAGKIDIVLCKDMSRFTRDKIVTEEYLETKFMEWNVRFIGLSDGSDTADKANKKSREINALVNQWYAEDISNKIRAVFKTKREEGSFIGSYATYGYVKSDKVKGKLEIDPEAAPVVKNIFLLYLEGCGTYTIARMLNEEGILNPASYKKSKHPNYKNAFQKDHRGLWSKTSVMRVLKNEVYIGNIVQHKCEKIHFKTKKHRNLPKEEWEIVENTHEPIIDRDTFLKVQELLNMHIRSTGKGTPHIFAGKVICKDCGSALAKSSYGSYHYLSCSKYRLDNSSCSKHSIQFDVLTETVEQRIRNLLSDLIKDKEKFLRQLVENDDFTSSIKSLQAKRDTINYRVKDLTTALKTLYMEKSQGKVDAFIFGSLQEEFLKEKCQLDKQLEILNAQLTKANDQNDRLEYWSKVLEKYSNFDELTREMVNELIDFIEIGERGDGPQEVVIHYSFRICV